MRKTIIILAALSLSACATVQEGFVKIGKVQCDNRDALRQSYLFAFINAQTIEDPTARQLTILAAQAGLDALATCPTPTSSADPTPPAT